jgi:hypothetical protein
MGRFTSAIAFAAVVAASTARAAAAPPMSPDPDPASPAPPSPAGPVWYGGTMLLVDTAGLGLAAAGVMSLASPSGSAAGLVPVGGGAILYLVSGPTMHAVHHEGTKAGLSVVLRLAAPIVGMAVGQQLGSQDSSCRLVAREGAGPADESYIAACSNATLVGSVEGILVGMATATVFDAVVLAWGDPDPVQPDRRPPAPPSFQWTPSVGAAKDAGQGLVPTLGITGTF